jgi:hypothetical protein
MKIAVYTSFAVNYLAKARVLANTIHAANPAIDVVALVCDRFPATIDAAAEPFAAIWMVEEYPATELEGWIFKHNIMELSTAVKGWALKRLLNAGYDYVMYLDPDCWVMQDPASIIELLPPTSSVGVVPHTTEPAISQEEIRLVETSSLRHGIYNLGFVIVKNDDKGRLLANWWAERLDKYCMDDFKSGLFTDQRWFDLAVGYFDFIHVIRHHGIDVASWNIGRRSLVRMGSGYSVDGDPLIFYHFSGVGPTGVHRWVRDKFAPSDPLAAEIEFRYEALINEQEQQKLQYVVPYFDCYSDGERISASHRIYFREHPEVAEKYPNPYSVERSPNFRDVARLNSTAAASSSSIVTPSIVVGDVCTGARFCWSSMDRLEVDALARRFFDAEHYALSLGDKSGNLDALWQSYLTRGWTDWPSGNRLFDISYYKLMLGDLDTEGQTPLHHYVVTGIRRAVSPSWIYDDQYYLSRYPDVADAIRRGDVICGFEHFSKYGVLEGRSGCCFFNERRYLELNPDVRDAVAAGTLRSGEYHYVRYGRSEGRAFR